jgi:DNA-binding beta-propeller fold protein YncE
MKVLLLLLSLLSVAPCCREALAQFVVAKEAAAAPALQLLWSTEPVFQTPGSVCYDEYTQHIYVSSLGQGVGRNNGLGFISKVDAAGKVLNLKWVKGLNSPAGMATKNGLLYVADGAEVVVISLASGEVRKRIPCPGAKFLNDIALDKSGNIYATDIEAGHIFVDKESSFAPLATAKGISQPNGIAVHKEMLYYVNFDNGELWAYNLVTSKASLAAKGLPGADGLVALPNGGFIISQWEGYLNWVGASGKPQRLLSLKDQALNTADIFYAADKKLLLVPTFYGNTLQAYSVAGLVEK